MNVSEGLRRLAIAFSVIFWGIVAFSAYETGQRAGKTTSSSPVVTYEVEGRCYELRRPKGLLNEGRRVAESADRRFSGQQEVVIVPGPPGSGTEYRLPICRKLPDRFWWSAALLTVWSDVLKPAAVLWLALLATWFGARWILRGFASKKTDVRRS